MKALFSLGKKHLGWVVAGISVLILASSNITESSPPSAPEPESSIVLPTEVQNSLLEEERGAEEVLVSPVVEAKQEVNLLPSPLPSPRSSAVPSPYVVSSPWPKVSPMVKVASPKPIAPVVDPPADSQGWTCNCKKTCPNLSCAEAQYQLNECGCSARDGDNDGVACDAQCR